VYTDSHCHPENKRFDSDRGDIFARAKAAGVTAILAIGNGDGPGTGTFDCAIRLAEQYEGVYATVGIHPHEAALAKPEDFDELVRLSKHHKIVGWGEIGLDYYYDHSPRDAQQRVFIQQMDLAAAAKLPIVIHCRPSDNSTNAWDDTLRLIRQHWAATGFGGVMHCFGGTVEQVRASLDLGFMISFAGNVTYPKAQYIRDAAAVVPLDRLLIETDSPYLAPVPHRGKRNEPSFVTETAKQIGLLREVSAEEIGLQTSENFRRFFNISPSEA